MIKEIVKAWDTNKDRLYEFLKATPQSEYDTYKKLVRIIFEQVINPYYGVEAEADIWYSYDGFDIKKLVEIDDGEYQGTLIYIIPFKTYQPAQYEYITTYVDYGSCSGCDALMRISGYEDGLPTESQLKLYMTLCLHIVQRIKWLYEK